MNWENLKGNKCPGCAGSIEIGMRITKCLSCDFKCRTNKLEELKKGKESKNYLEAVARYASYKKRAEKNKKKRAESTLAQNQERKSNLRRMLQREEIDQKEYDEKMKSL